LSTVGMLSSKMGGASDVEACPENFDCKQWNTYYSSYGPIKRIKGGGGGKLRSSQEKTIHPT
jgi:hypothetical protein